MLGDSEELKKVNREIATKAIAGLGITLTAGTGAGRSIASKVLPKLIPTTPLGVVGLAGGAGILASSRSARKVTSDFVKDPLKVGIEAGKLIDKAVAGKQLPTIAAALGAAGIVGAGVVAGKTVIDKLRTPSDVPTSIALPTAVVPTALSPISDAPVVATTLEPVSPKIQAPEVNIKIINKPQLNVAVAQSL